MDQKQVARICSLESFAAKNPGIYRARVALLASLGYVYLLFIVTVLLAFVAITVFCVRFNVTAIKLIWIPLALIWLVLRSLWITIPEPDGKELQREQAPGLFELIDEISRTLSGPKVDRVFVSGDFNAAIVQIPRFGMFGWFRNYLVVGLPLMRGLSPKEFRAVLAHEFGHLSHKHGRFAGWIYRVRQSWVQVLTNVYQERSYASFLFAPFLKWYAPFLGAYSFVLARAQEREADIYSVDLAGKNTAALALIRLTTKQRGLRENFWPTFFRGAKEQSLAPKDPFTQMLAGLEQSIGHIKAQKWFLEELRVKTGYDDTHPALGDRLAAMGFQKDGAELTALVEGVVKADEITESAAARYLRELPEDFEAGMNRLMRERLVPHWKNRHSEIKQAEKRIAKLDEEAQTRALTIDEQWERIRAIGETNTAAAALPALDALLAESPEHVGANFAVGAILLEQEDAKGIEYLNKIMQAGDEIASEACDLISGFYLQQGNVELTEKFRKLAEEHYQNAVQFHLQAITLTANDHFAAHDLDESRIKQMQTQLANVRGLGSAYLVRKLLDGSRPMVYVVAVTAEFIWKAGRSEKNVAMVFAGLREEVELPDPLVFVSLDQNAQLLPVISRIPGAKIFPA